MSVRPATAAIGLVIDASAKIGVQGHLLGLSRIKLTVGLVVDELSVPRYCDHRAGHTLGSDLAGEELVKPRQS